MKKIYLITLLLVIFGYSYAQKTFKKEYQGYSLELLESSTDGQLLTFNLKDYSIDNITIDNQNFSKINYAHTVTTNKKGYAEIPIINANLALYKNNNVKIEVVSEDYVDIPLEYPLIPSRGELYRNQDIESIPYSIDPASIVNALYPEELAFSEEPFILRDIRGVNIYVYPFRYNAAKGTLRVYNSISLRIKEDNSKPGGDIIWIRPDFIIPSFNALYTQMFINYEVDRFAHQLGEEGDILILTTSRDTAAIRPYAEWKRQNGFKVKTKVVSKGTNVKNTIADEYSNNPNILYVQLVGDWADIKSDLGGDANAPTDPMLGCVSGSDNYPDLIIGRFSASSSSEVTVQVNKAINYEKNPDMDGTWYSKALGIASDQGSGSGDDSEADYEHLNIIKKHKLLKYTYTSVGSEYDPDASASGVASYVNDGIGLINYTGHGSETSWASSGYNNTDINNSTNNNKLPFIFSVACVNGKFHRSYGDCFAEAWLKKENGGALVVIMSTINQPWVPPMRGQDYFNDILIGGYDYSNNPGNGTSTGSSDQRTTFGSITFNGNILMLAEAYNNAGTKNTIATWTIFGDASVQVRTKTPKPITVIADETITADTYTVTVKSGYNAVKNAKVTLCQGNKVYTAKTDNNGEATIYHDITNGQAKLTVTGYNYGTYQSTKSFGDNPQDPPTTPTNLTVSGIGDTYATVNWDAVTGASSYELQVRIKNGSWTTYNTSSTSYDLDNLSANTEYEVKVRAKNSAGNSNYTAITSFNTEDIVISYCDSKGKTYKYEWISKVEIGDFTNSSTGSSYSDFTNKTVTLEKGKDYNIKLTPGFLSSSYKEGWRIWIDLNNDGDFEGTDELVFDSELSKTSVTGTITIPANTSNTTTRMRISMKYNGKPSPCESFNYGEVEDYTVKIIEGSNEPPAIPTGLTTSNITETTAKLSWTAVSDATSYEVRIRESSETNWGVYTTTYNYKELSGLTSNTNYEWNVKALNDNGSSNYSDNITFKTNEAETPTPPAPSDYCTSKGKNSNYEWIDFVQFEEIKRTSGNDGGYIDKTDLTATVNPGSSYRIYFSAGFKNYAYKEYWGIWIDFNQNGTFEDNERLVEGYSTSSGKLYSDIEIPSDAKLGTTRLRISMKYKYSQEACEIFNYGEVEDYSVIITDQRKTELVTNDNEFSEALSIDNISSYLYPNPTENVIYVEIPESTKGYNVTIYNIEGKVVAKEVIYNSNNPIDVSNLKPGYYLLNLDDEREGLTEKFIKK